jgi:hypothetical protein
MRMRVDVHSDVDWFVRKTCTREKRAEFYRMLAAIELEPLRHSEPFFEPKLSPHMLRFFRFGTSKAIFEFDPARNRIQVIECRKLKPILPPSETGNGS